MAPAAWWGLRCALTFLGELIWSEEGIGGMGMEREGAWSVEKRFRITEVFLAILWVSEFGVKGGGRVKGVILFSSCLSLPSLHFPSPKFSL